MSVIWIPYQAPITAGGDPSYSSVSLLLHCDGANNSTTFTDNSPSPKTASVFGDAKISTAQSKFGGASALFDGNGDYIEYTVNTAFAFGTGNFTVECWVWRNGTQVDFAPLISAGSSGGTSGSWVLGFGATSESSSNKLRFTTGLTPVMFDAGVSPNQQWFHAAVARQGSTVRLFVDGVQVATMTSAADLTESLIRITRGRGSAFYFNGYLDDIRITKGVARYTGNFTPPSASFPDA